MTYSFNCYLLTKNRRKKMQSMPIVVSGIDRPNHKNLVSIQIWCNNS